MKKFNLLLQNFILKHYKNIGKTDSIYSYILYVWKVTLFFLILAIFLLMLNKLLDIKYLFTLNVLKIAKSSFSTSIFGFGICSLLYLYNKSDKN